MKTFKLFLLFVAISSVTFYSCSDSSPIENDTPTAQKSVALRTTIFELVKANPPGDRPSDNSTKANRLTPATPFCFEFVYPIVMSYNNGTAVTISSSEGLWDIINNESANLFLEGIVFPFQVVKDVTYQTINSESEFVALINNCGFNNLYDEIHNTYCFDIVFPITLEFNGQTVIINSEQELLIFGDAPGFSGQINIVFPISVSYQGQIVVINSLYEFYQMAANCSNTCVCTQEYAPVCVQTPNGIVEFGNLCYAICAGYTQNDLVSCIPINECTISNLTVTPGTCDINGSYPLTINFDYTNTSATQFEVWSTTSSSFPIGSYPLSSLPFTLTNYPQILIAEGSLTVKISGNTTCSATQQFPIPDCSPCNCPTNFDPVCVQSGGGIVQYNNTCLAECAGFTANDFINCGIAPNNFSTQLGTCFNITYPVTVQYQGAVYTVNSNSQLLQYYNSTIQAMPAMNYPIAVTWGAQTATFTYNSQAEFQVAVSANCP
jgi:hypothetical protein